MNEEEKKAIDFLKETNFDYLEYDMCVSSVEIISNLVERLQKENEELKNQEATQRKINELLVQRYSNSISVQKVKDKTEELEEELEIMKVDNMYGRYKEYGGKTK